METLGLSLKDEVKLSLEKVVKSYLYYVIMPLYLLYFLFYLALENNQIMIQIYIYLAAIIAQKQWIFLTFLIPLYFVTKDLISYVIRKTLLLIFAIISPAYIKIYNKGVWIKGVGYIENDGITDFHTDIRNLVFKIEKNKSLKRSLLSALTSRFFCSIKLDGDYRVIKIFIEPDFLNKSKKELFKLLPFKEPDKFSNPETNVDWDHKKRQFTSIANSDDVI